MRPVTAEFAQRCESIREEIELLISPFGWRVQLNHTGYGPEVRAQHKNTTPNHPLSGRVLCASVQLDQYMITSGCPRERELVISRTARELLWMGLEVVQKATALPTAPEPDSRTTETVPEDFYTR